MGVLWGTVATAGYWRYCGVLGGKGVLEVLWGKGVLEVLWVLGGTGVLEVLWGMGVLRSKIG